MLKIITNRQMKPKTGSDAWKNPKQRELKGEKLKISVNKAIGDAWKNPKQRELKAGLIILGGIGIGLRCMEKSQAKGIESFV